MLKLLLVVAVLLVVVGGLFLWASSGWDGGTRDTAGHVELRELLASPPGPAGEHLTVLTWNVAFGGGAGKQPTERHTRAHVLASLSRIASAIKPLAPDVVFLQEVDRPSERSGEVDQLQVLQDTLGLPHACFATTWRLNYLPFPPWPPSRHVGRVWSGQAILSRFPIVDCDRIPLPQPAEQPWWYNRFFLHRALQVVHVQVEAGRRLALVNVHLEAFSQSNRAAQAALLAAALGRLDPATALVVAGDLNTVPAAATKKAGFVDEPETDFSTDATLATVRAVPGLREVFLDDAPDVPEADTLTFPAEAPSRRLDYVFARGLGPSTGRSVVPDPQASDHRPLVARLPWR